MRSTTAEKRRSDRLWLTIPVHLQSVDSNGHLIELEGRVVNLNRYGARIQVPWALERGQTVRIQNPLSHSSGQFRVVKTVVPAAVEKDGEFGVECLDETENFWGIEFPAPEQGNVPDAKALLECGICHTMALWPLTFSQVEALRMIGSVGMTCHHCTAETPWSFAEVGAPSYGGDQSSTERPFSWPTSDTVSIERDQGRIYLQVPLNVRDSRGSAEDTWTENISKTGFCFSSRKKYTKDEMVTSVFPFNEITRQSKLAARIVREQTIEGSDRKIYGAMFEAHTAPKPIVV